MKLYNTKTRKTEDFKPLSSREVKVYSCGPTVYNYAHIGNLRAYIFEDIVVRTLRFLGYNVIYTMNITDIDDKTIRDSQKEGIPLKEFTEKYSKIFLEDCAKLNILKPNNVVPISTIIPEMVRMINTMIRRKNAYLGEDGSIYFDVKSFKKYGEFANLDMANLKAGARVDNDEYDKESASDFVLWKAWKESDGENFWNEEFIVEENNGLCYSDEGQNKLNESNTFLKKENYNLKDSVKTPLTPFIKGEISSTEGHKTKKIILKGRPGWHIECSACNMKYFGQQIDIHMGGIDLIFPHHQNEIAQTESCTHKEFSKYWLHSGHLMVDGKKMAKSAGNFYRLIDLENTFKNIQPSVLYRAIRLGYINAKYNSELDFSFDKLESNISVIKGIDETIKNLNRELNGKNDVLCHSWVSDSENRESLNNDYGHLKDSVSISATLNNQSTEGHKVGVRKEFSDKMQEFITYYIEKLEDNFNTPEAIAIFHEFLKFVNILLRNNEFNGRELESLLDMLKTFDQVLAILDFEVLNENDEISAEILEKFEERNEAKKEKNFEKADKIRDELLKFGYKIVDNREGSYLEKI